MHGHRRSCRTIVSEEFAVYLVIAGEIVHVYKVGREFHYILQLRSRTLQNVADVLNHRTRLLADVEPRCAEWIDFSSSNRIVGGKVDPLGATRLDFSSSNRIVGAARTGSGHKKEITCPLDVRILSARRCFSFDDFALDRAHIRSVSTLTA